MDKAACGASPDLPPRQWLQPPSAKSPVMHWSLRTAAPSHYSTAPHSLYPKAHQIFTAPVGPAGRTDEETAQGEDKPHSRPTVTRPSSNLSAA